MICVRYEPDVPAISVSGHAGFAPKGGDIVCAAASILMYALKAAADDSRAGSSDAGSRAIRESPLQSGETGQDAADATMGDDRFNLFSLTGRETDREAFRFAALGYWLLARNYPDNVKFEVKK